MAVALLHSYQISCTHFLNSGAMALLARRAANGARVNSDKMNVKEVVIEVYSGMDVTVKAIRFQRARMGQVVSKKMLENRREVQNDNRLGWLRGLISSDPAKQPAFRQRLMESVPVGCICSYESPNSPNNFTSFQHPDGAHDPLHLPACWTLMLVADSTPKFVELLDVFFQVAVLSLEAGWAPQGDGSNLLLRTAAPPNREPWTEAMTLTLAPRGQYDCKEAMLFADLRDKYSPWLGFDGSMAYVTPPEGTLPV